MRYRSRLCQRGDLDKEVPITFAPTALIQSIRFLIAVAAHYGIDLELNDIYTKTNKKLTQKNLHRTRIVRSLVRRVRSILDGGILGGAAVLV